MTAILNKRIDAHEYPVSDEDMRKPLSQLLREALDAFGLRDEAGKPLPNVRWSVQYTGSQANGGYEVRITRDLSKSQQAVLPAQAKAIP